MQNWRISLLFIPAAAFVALFTAYPLLRMFAASLGAPEFDFDAYHRLSSDPATAIIGMRTFVFAFQVTLLCILIGYPVAAFLSKQTSIGRGYLVVLVALPYLTSLLVRTYAWILILGDAGPINSFLVGTGLTDTPALLLFSRFGALVGSIHIALPLMVLPIYAVMRSVDANLSRAALALGATRVQTFIQIYLPQTIPGVVSGTTLVFVLVLGFYITPAALGGLGESLLANVIVNRIQFSQDFTSASAISMALLAVTLIVFFALHAIDKKKQLGSSRHEVRANQVATWVLRAVELLNLHALVARLWRWRLGRKSGPDHLAGQFMTIFCAGVLVYLIIPNVIVLAMSFNSGDVVSFPPEGFSFRWYQHAFEDESWGRAFLLSLQIAIPSALASVLLGASAAYAMTRGPAIIRRFGMPLLLLPMIVPAVVLGVGLFGLFLDLKILGTNTAIFFTHVVVGIPYSVLIVYAALQGFDWRLQNAALSLGASNTRTVFKVLMPAIASALAAAGVFAFMGSFDEVVKTSFIAGVTNRTLPLKIWDNIQFQTDPTIAAVSSMLLMFPVLAFLVVRKKITS